MNCHSHNPPYLHPHHSLEYLQYFLLTDRSILDGREWQTTMEWSAIFIGLFIFNLFFISIVFGLILFINACLYFLSMELLSLSLGSILILVYGSSFIWLSIASYLILLPFDLYLLLIIGSSFIICLYFVPIKWYLYLLLIYLLILIFEWLILLTWYIIYMFNGVVFIIIWFDIRLSLFLCISITITIKI